MSEAGIGREFGKGGSRERLWGRFGEVREVGDTKKLLIALKSEEDFLWRVILSLNKHTQRYLNKAFLFHGYVSIDHGCMYRSVSHGSDISET